ncbi:MAG: SusC/RagA family TonB-linked outer membrane protein [Gemmatimonadetes bacterium]|nr:SusC/RagA family TonB-linked outer membrane protein [Gemmatimonadota bacterium]
MALALMLGWSPAPIVAQTTGTLVGTVRDAASQRPLEAVQVYIGGTGIGALTNAAGRFLLLNVPAGEHTLVAEIVGYRSGSQTVTVAAGQSVVADFALQQTAITLDEVVVTGAGVATEKRKLGNTIATLDASTVENAPVNNFSEMIAAREAGVQMLPSSGYTGEGARIRIRGSSSLSQLNEPIIYVDGIRVNRQAIDANNGQGNPSRLDDIDPAAIERVEILKGAAAATLYGTEASNGVIQIFTKRGRAGAPRFSAQADWSAISVPTNRMLPVADYIGRDCEAVDCTDATDAATIAEIQGRMQQRFGISPGPFEPFEQELIPEMLSTGFGQTYSASVNGGSDAFQYFVSARLADEDGPYNPQQNFPLVEGLDVETDTNRRATFTSNFTVVPSDKVRIGVSTLYSDMEHHTPDNGNNIYGVFSSILMTQLRRATPQSETGEGSNYYGNPAFATTRENMYQQNFVNSQHFAGSANIGFTPTQTFRLDGTFGIDFTSDDAVAFRPYAWNIDGFSGSTPDGSRSVEEYRSREITADVKGSLITMFGENIENTLLFGGQGFLRQNQEAGGSGSVFPGPGLETLSALANEGSFETWTRVTQLGGYLQDQVGINDWVFLTVGGRWDANSAFGEDFSTAFYPKASASIVPSQGLGWENETFSTFRVRAAIGQSGLQPDAFAKFTTYAPAPSEAGPGVEPANLGNDALQPEVSTEWELGAEVGLFNDRWSVDVTYWDRTVSDALVSRQFSVTGGFVAEQLVNIGELVGQGFEVSLRGTAIQQEGFSMNVFANTAWLSEEITSLGGAPPLKTGGSYPRYRNFLVEGYTPGAFFGSTTADVAIPLNLDGTCTVPTEADALAYFATPRSPSDFKPLAPANSDFGTPIEGQYSSNNCGEGLLLSYLGKPTPDFAGSFGFNMSFATNFEFNTLFEYKQGVQNQDLSGMFRRANAVIGRNTPRAAELGSIMGDPSSTAQQRLDAAVDWANEIEGLSPMSGMNGVYDSSLIRFREASLTYRIPSDIVEGWGLSTATLNLGARNLHMWVFGDYTGMDPETNVIGRCNGGLNCNFLNNTEGWSIPIPRRFTLSTRITF